MLSVLKRANRASDEWRGLARIKTRTRINGISPSCMVKKDGPVVAAACSLGSQLTKRRCDVGTSKEWKCTPAITNQSIVWPMAISIWKIGHPDF